METDDKNTAYWLNFNPAARAFNVTENGTLIKVFTKHQDAIDWLERWNLTYFHNANIRGD